MIGVIRYDAGNTTSVLAALRHLKLPAMEVIRPDDMSRCERIILPGVGSAETAMNSLTHSGILGALEQQVKAQGMPFLGICIGMQILFERSEEGSVSCLGWERGTVERLPATLRVPQMGWNAVRWKKRHFLTSGLPEKVFFYFVNSYFVSASSARSTVGVSNYGEQLCALTASGNVAGTQFHTEKSSIAGLQILKNFSMWVP